MSDAVMLERIAARRAELDEAEERLVKQLAEVRHLVLPNARIIAMATVDAAEALGLSEITGRVAPGLRADLLVVDGDPLADLGALKAVTAVVADGRLHGAGQ
jgi:imidazolonepropionase-like amidohydrolase